jgi:hypothetical protein
MSATLAATPEVEPVLRDAGARSVSSQMPNTDLTSTSPDSSELVTVPNFGTSRTVYAITSRIAGRINARAVSEEEHQRLLDERQFLLDKKIAGSISPAETNRLEYVRWSLDRIEDARHGAEIDALESSIAQYEQFLSDVGTFTSQLQQARAGRK